MGKHQFGGDWTEAKLDRLKQYLVAYRAIFSKNPKAQFYKTCYVDAFAGSGYRLPSAADPTDPDEQAYRKGSARIALEIEPPFDEFIFIEQCPERVQDLTAMRIAFPNRADRVRIEPADANAFLQQWCKATNWKRHRAVVFLDPYGMQVQWATLTAIAATRAIDMWLLFPLGMAVMRLLTKAGPPPPEWASALTRIFGTDEWRSAFYPPQTEELLWGSEETHQRTATLRSVGHFFVARLQSIFEKVAANPLPLVNSQNTPIYLLCFAAGNKKGADIAVRIAQHILRNE